MKSIRIVTLGCAATALAFAGLVMPTAAQAGGSISWSIGISGGVPVHRRAAPIYGQPRPIYVQPRPIYVQPRPVYVQPQPVYVVPPPYYGGAVVAAPAPVLIAPRGVHPTGWAPRGHRHHRHGHGYGDGYGHGSGWRY